MSRRSTFPPGLEWDRYHDCCSDDVVPAVTGLDFAMGWLFTRPDAALPLSCIGAEDCPSSEISSLSRPRGSDVGNISLLTQQKLMMTHPLHPRTSCTLFDLRYGSMASPEYLTSGLAPVDASRDLVSVLEVSCELEAGEQADRVRLTSASFI